MNFFKNPANWPSIFVVSILLLQIPMLLSNIELLTSSYIPTVMLAIECILGIMVVVLADHIGEY